MRDIIKPPVAAKCSAGRSRVNMKVSAWLLLMVRAEQRATKTRIVDGLMLL